MGTYRWRMLPIETAAECCSRHRWRIVWWGIGRSPENVDQRVVLGWAMSGGPGAGRSRSGVGALIEFVDLDGEPVGATHDELTAIVFIGG